jgi:hypothetical protein
MGRAGALRPRHVRAPDAPLLLFVIVARGGRGLLVDDPFSDLS